MRRLDTIRLLWTLLLLGWAAGGAMLSLRAEDATVHQLRARTVKTVALLTRWAPERLASGETLRIGVSAAEETEAVLQAFAAPDRRAGLPHEARGVHSSEPEVVQACHVILVLKGTPKAEREALQKLNQSGILWIGENPEAAFKAPGVVGIFERDGKLRLRLNIQHARAQHLAMDSKLFPMVETVKP